MASLHMVVMITSTDLSQETFAFDALTVLKRSLRATSHLSVKRERPLIINYSLFCTY